MGLRHRDYQHVFSWKYGLRFVVVLLNNKARYCAAFSGFCFLRGTIRQHRVWFVIVFLIFLRLSTRKDRTGLIVVLLFRVFSRGEVVVLVGGGGDDGRRQVGGGGGGGQQFLVDSLHIFL